jgi:hypothetical protein
MGFKGLRSNDSETKYKRSDVIKRKKRNNGKAYSNGSQKSLQQYLCCTVYRHNSAILVLYCAPSQQRNTCTVHHHNSAILVLCTATTAQYFVLCTVTTEQYLYCAPSQQRTPPILVLCTFTTAHTADTGKSIEQRLQLFLGALR